MDNESGPTRRHPPDGLRRVRTGWDGRGSAPSTGGTAGTSSVVPCPLCARPPDAFDDVAGTLLQQIDTTAPGFFPARPSGSGRDRRRAVVARLVRELVCLHADRRVRPGTDVMSWITAGVRRLARDGTDPTTTLGLLQRLEYTVDTWLWDERWPAAVAPLSLATQRIVTVGANLRTWYVATYLCRSARDVMELSVVAAVDPDAADRVAKRLGVDLGASWCLVHPVGGAAIAPRPVTEQAVAVVPTEAGRCWIVPAEAASNLTAGRLPPDVTIATSYPVSTVGLRTGVDQVVRIARVAAAAGLAGVVTLADVAVDTAILGAPQALRELPMILDELERQAPGLTRTLERLYANDLNRSRTAADLDVHRSTLESRLSRVRVLTGHNPVSTRGVLVLTAALTAVRLRGSGGRATSSSEG